MINLGFYASFSSNFLSSIEYNIEIHKILLGFEPTLLKTLNIPHDYERPQWLYRRAIMSLSSIFENKELITSTLCNNNRKK